jgi:hypothetical protein
MKGRVRRFSLPTLGLLILAAGAGSSRRAGADEAAPWERFFSPTGPLLTDLRRPIGPGVATVPLFEGRVLVVLPGGGAEAARSVSADLEARLALLLEGEPWLRPFSPASPLRITLFASGGPSSSVRLAGVREGMALAPALEIRTAGRGLAEVGEEVARGVALLALRTWAPQAPDRLSMAAARAVALTDTLTESDREEIREAAASPSGTLTDGGGEILGALWIREMLQAAGPGFLPAAWSALDGAPRPYVSLASAYEAAAGEPAEEAFRRALRRAYSSVDVLPDFSRISLDGLEAGALDAASPGFLSWRYSSTSPTRDGGVIVRWPEDGARAFAVLHYEDGLPDDLVDLSAGDEKTLPLAGVSRIDWIVAGTDGPRAPLAAPVEAAVDDRFPVAGLSARAESASQDGVRLEWSTASHRDLAGWAILRSEVDTSGEVVRTGPDWLPAREEDVGGSSYFYIDSSAAPGRFYRYDVWAVTREGALSRSFRVTLRAR